MNTIDILKVPTVLTYDTSKFVSIDGRNNVTTTDRKELFTQVEDWAEMVANEVANEQYACVEVVARGDIYNITKVNYIPSTSYDQIITRLKAGKPVTVLYTLKSSTGAISRSCPFFIYTVTGSWLYSRGIINDTMYNLTIQLLTKSATLNEYTGTYCTFDNRYSTSGTRAIDDVRWAIAQYQQYSCVLVIKENNTTRTLWPLGNDGDAQTPSVYFGEWITENGQKAYKKYTVTIKGATYTISSEIESVIPTLWLIPKKDSYGVDITNGTASPSSGLTSEKVLEIVNTGNPITISCKYKDSTIYFTPTGIEKETFVLGYGYDRTNIWTLWIDTSDWTYGISFSPTQIPTKLSELENDTNYVNTSQLATKQDVLVSGTTIKTVNGESLLGTGNIPAGYPFVIIPYAKSEGNLGEDGIKVYNAIKDNSGFCAWLKVETASVLKKCEYLLPVGFDKSKPTIIIRFEHIHYTAQFGYTLPQSLERIEVHLNKDGSYTYVDDSTMIATPTVYLSGATQSVYYSGRLSEINVVNLLKAGNPISVAYIESLSENLKTIYLTSFEDISLLATKAYGIDGDKLYTAVINFSAGTFTITSKTLNFNENN